MLKQENKIFKNLYNNYGWEIDNAIKNVITEIKAEERKIADRENAIHNAAPQVSVAT